MYEFRPEFLTGIEELDKEHQKIFSLTNEAYNLLKDENMLYKQDELHHILRGISDYTLAHFKDEENYMESIQFSELELQKKQHRIFEQKVEEFIITSLDMSLANQDELLLKLLDYLANWLKDHILEMDLKYKK